MEPVNLVFDKLKAVAKSGQDFFHGLFDPRRNSVQILKRLNREAFSDIMKLRDRQEKVERLLSFYKSSKGGPFQESTTHVRGRVDMQGALLIMDSLDQQSLDAITTSRIRTGIGSKFIFETNVGQDTLAAEFVTCKKGKEHPDDVLEMPLSLAKLSYTKNVNDWLSLMAIPIGARCRDVGIASNSSDQGLTDFSSFGPPLLNLHNGSGIGITVRKSNIIASLAQFVAGLGMPSGTNTIESTSSTFGKLVSEFSWGKLSLLGLHQVPLPFTKFSKVGSHMIPIVLSRQRKVSETVPEVSPRVGARTHVSIGSIALVAESELADYVKFGGWIEMENPKFNSVQWALTMSDVSEDPFGWGLSLSGMIGDSTSDHFQVESYLKFNMGNKLCLKPGLAYVMHGDSKVAALMLRSEWSL
ncbi:hypothetical protein PIB30_074614 [Stylosanthes scabra]|uniref:Uncharacterized protein n=1 Tax=Stylosanthes scabra TaxID=79078 RepID=A0ABU6WPK0_9FABA|nr:hypothetical protein [Stylosanthes scabra]